MIGKKSVIVVTPEGSFLCSDGLDKCEICGDHCATNIVTVSGAVGRVGVPVIQLAARPLELGVTDSGDYACELCGG
jgi:hypothetical protein